MNLKINAGMLCFGEVNTPRDVLEEKYSAAFNEVGETGLGYLQGTFSVR